MGLKVRNRFNFFEVTLMRIGYYGYQIIGAIAIFKSSIIFGLIYLLFIIAGSFGVFYTLCTHCPHLYGQGKCIWVPFGLQRFIFKKFRKEKMTVAEIIIHNTITKGAILIPQFWLFKDFSLLIVFWILVIPVLLRLSFYHCRQCRNSSCPFSSFKDHKEFTAVP